MPIREQMTSNKIKNKRRQSGQSLIETMAGLVLIIPLALFSYDLTFILISSQNNERLAENAARAAANHATNLKAQQAAQQAIDTFNQANPNNTATLTNFSYDQGDGQVSLVTQIKVNLPVPFGAWSTFINNAQSIVPVLATPAPI